MELFVRRHCPSFLRSIQETGCYHSSTPTDYNPLNSFFVANESCRVDVDAGYHFSIGENIRVPFLMQNFLRLPPKC